MTAILITIIKESIKNFVGFVSSVNCLFYYYLFVYLRVEKNVSCVINIHLYPSCSVKPVDRQKRMNEFNSSKQDPMVSGVLDIV